MLTFWIQDRRPGAQPVVSVPFPGTDVATAEWSLSYGVPAYLADRYEPGAQAVLFLNGDPHAAIAAARAEQAAQAAKVAREAEEEAWLLLAAE